MTPTRTRLARTLLVAALLSVAAPAVAVLTRSWVDEGLDAFLAGETEGLALASDGALVPAPLPRLLPGPAPDASVTALAVGPDGTVVAGTSFGGRILVRRPGAADFSPLVDLDAPMVTALLLTDGTLWAATAPDGGLVALDPATGQIRRTVATEESWLWCLLAGDDGALLAGSGPSGRVLRIDAGGVTTLAETGQHHVMALARRPDGSLLAATADEGLLLDLGPSGRGPVRALFQPPQPECRGLVVDPRTGVAWLLATTAPRAAAALRRTRRPPTPETRRPDGSGEDEKDKDKDKEKEKDAPDDETDARGSMGGSEPSAPVTTTPSGDDGGAAPRPPASASERRGALSPEREAALRSFLERVRGGAPAPRSTARVAFSDGAEHGAHALYAVTPDGVVSTLFSSKDAVLFSLARDGDGGLILGSGNDGFLYRVDPGSGRTERLAAVSDDQIVSLAATNDDLVLGCSNGGHLWSLPAAPASTGSFVSAVKSLPHSARFGALAWSGDHLAPDTVTVATRSGFTERPDETWAPWAPALPGSTPGSVTTSSPPARFFQYRLDLRCPAPNAPLPRIRRVETYFRPGNLAPRLRRIEVAGPEVELSSRRDELKEAAGAKPGKPGLKLLPYMRRVSWKAEDPNGDKLLARLYAAREGSDLWLEITEDEMEGSGVIWETQSIPDGRWRIRVDVHDGAVNVPDEVLSASLVSADFLVDNTPPVLTDVTAAVEGDRVVVRGVAFDAGSRILNVEYSLDGDYWRALAPLDGMFDAPDETFGATLYLPRGGRPVTLGVKAFDEFGNVATLRLALPGR